MRDPYRRREFFFHSVNVFRDEFREVLDGFRNRGLFDRSDPDPKRKNIFEPYRVAQIFTEDRRFYYRQDAIEYHQLQANAEVLALSRSIGMDIERVYALTMYEYYSLMLANKELMPKDKNQSQ